MPKYTHRRKIRWKAEGSTYRKALLQWKTTWSNIDRKFRIWGRSRGQSVIHDKLMKIKAIRKAGSKKIAQRKE